MLRSATFGFFALTCVAAIPATVLAVPPAAPLVLAVASGANVDLAWTADPTATSYDIYRIHDLAVLFQLLASVVVPSYSDVGALPSPPATYFYQVVARNSDGPSPPSNMASKLNLVLDPSVQPAEGFPISLPYLRPV